MNPSALRAGRRDLLIGAVVALGLHAGTFALWSGTRTRSASDTPVIDQAMNQVTPPMRVVFVAPPPAPRVAPVRPVPQAARSLARIDLEPRPATLTAGPLPSPAPLAPTPLVRAFAPDTTTPATTAIRPGALPALPSRTIVTAGPAPTAPAARTTDDAPLALAATRELAAPTVIGNPRPAYPRMARERGYEGTVTLNVHVGKHGKTLAVEILRSSGHRILDRAALRAVERWRYHPATENGQPTAIWIELPVEFSLTDADS